MDIRLVRKLRQGVILSPLVAKEIQLLLEEKKSE